MKALLSFVRNTLTGGILFLLPIVLIILLLKKAHEIIYVLVDPLAQRMPDIFFGFDGSRTVALIVLITICFLSGLMVRSAFIKRFVSTMEDRLLIHLPGYALIKSATAGALGKDDQNGLMPIITNEEGKTKVGFLVEEQGVHCVVFFPEPVNSNSGEVVIMSSADIRRLDIPANKVTKSMKQFGKGLLQYIE